MAQANERSEQVRSKPSKPREQYVYIGCDQKFNRVGFSADSFILPNDGKTYWVFHQRQYPRGEKPKVIYALFQFFGSRAIKKDPLDELRKYDRVFAIDTNYKDVAVSTAVEGVWWPAKTGMNIRLIGSRRFVPSSPNPEREAWAHFISTHSVDSGQKYCLIVDSDLGQLMKINRRELPVTGDFFLCDNWQLNYATSDVSDDFVTVRMLRLCEKRNTKLMQP